MDPECTPRGRVRVKLRGSQPLQTSHTDRRPHSSPPTAPPCRRSPSMQASRATRTHSKGSTPLSSNRTTDTNADATDRPTVSHSHTGLHGISPSLIPQMKSNFILYCPPSHSIDDSLSVHVSPPCHVNHCPFVHKSLIAPITRNNALPFSSSITVT